jgi:hypothetical protein
MNARASLWLTLVTVGVLLIASRTQRGQAIIAAGVDEVGKVVRGLRNKNPGNLRANQFRGSLGVDKDGYGIFDTMANGVRGSARQLKLYVSRGTATPEQIISTWAPSNENDTALYIANFVKWTGLPARGPVTWNEDNYLKALRAIFRKELGAVAAATISDAMILQGIREA